MIFKKYVTNAYVMNRITELDKIGASDTNESILDVLNRLLSDSKID